MHRAGRRHPGTYRVRPKPGEVGSAVQYLKFTLPPEAPVHLGGDFAAMEVSVDLDEVQLGAMATDLAATLC